MIEHLRQFVDAGDVAGLFAAFPYAQFVGLEGRLDDQGKLITVLAEKPSNVGNTVHQNIHGGVIAGLLEHSAMMSLIWEGRLDRMPKVINLSVDYLRPCRLADTYARAEVIRQGRRVANVRVTAWQVDPVKPVATAHSHCLLGERAAAETPLQRSDIP